MDEIEYKKRPNPWVKWGYGLIFTLGALTIGLWVYVQLNTVPSWEVGPYPLVCANFQPSCVTQPK